MSAQELSSLVQRLEAVALKLEATQAGKGAASEIRRELSALKSNPAGAAAKLSSTLDALEGATGGAVSQEDLSASVSAFDEIVNGPLKTFLALSAKIGGDVATHGKMVDAAFTAQRKFLGVASKAKQPGSADMPVVLKPQSDHISEIQAFREKNRRSDFFNHLSAVSESIPALGWVAVAPAPSPFVKEMNDAGQFYTNRVLKDFKEKDKTHVEWVKAWVSTLSEIQAYVKQHHTTGLVWNAKGGDAKAMMSSGAPAPPPAGGAPLPPPPPPPGMMAEALAAGGAGGKGGGEKTARSALFAEINQGEGVTKGLKKVTSDMQTHKNPNLRGSGAVDASAKPATAPKPKYGSAVAPAAQKPPKFELDGKKWVVEFFKNNPGIEIEKVEVNQSVYVYKCEGSTVKVNGKCNNLILDSCKKTAVVFDSAVSSCEFINCQSVQMQVLGSVPTVSVEKTDGCQMFLSKDSVNTEIISAKSSEMNVMIPNGDDFVEQPVPEQYKTKIHGTKLVTTVSESI